MTMGWTGLNNTSKIWGNDCFKADTRIYALKLGVISSNLCERIMCPCTISLYSLCVLARVNLNPAYFPRNTEQRRHR